MSLAEAVPAAARSRQEPAATPRFRQTLRRQILLAVMAIDACCCLASAVVVIFNAREATRVEVGASLEMAEPLVRETIASFQRSAPDDISGLQFDLPGVRHVRISVHRPDGSLVSSREPMRPSAFSPAPAWFARLIESPLERQEIPVVADGELRGMVAIQGEPADEIAEVWEDMTSLAALLAAFNVLGLAAFALLLRRILSPLGALGRGLAALERGGSDQPLPVPHVQELAVLAERFNALAVALGEERDRNARLSHRMVFLQDDERRQIAAELHDELGPCLFGLQANLGLLKSGLSESGGLAAPAQERLATAIDISNRLQTLNRHLLRRLKPIALGEAPLGEVLSGLVAEFERRHPDHQFALLTAELRTGYGPVMDLTVYRAVQEGITNALKHAVCTTIEVRVEEQVVNGRAELAIQVIDDGVGVPAETTSGFGLLGLAERIQALRGRFRLRSVPAGAALEIFIPLSDAEEKRR